MPGESDPSPRPPVSEPALALSDGALRQVETALVELDFCRRQGQLLEQQVSVCSEKASITDSIITHKDVALEKLNAALADKDQILARREAALRAELKVARGSWRTRLLRAARYVAAGVVAGVVLR